jgi:hypothetical protein
MFLVGSVSLRRHRKITLLWDFHFVLIQVGAHPIERLLLSILKLVGSYDQPNSAGFCAFFAVFAVSTFLDAYPEASGRKECRVDVRKPNSIQNVQECDATEGDVNWWSWEQRDCLVLRNGSLPKNKPACEYPGGSFTQQVIKKLSRVKRDFPRMKKIFPDANPIQTPSQYFQPSCRLHAF